MKNKKILVIVVIIILVISLVCIFSKTNNKINIELGKMFTLNKYFTKNIRVDNHKFKIKIISIKNNTCPENAQCQVDYFTVKLKINGETYELGVGYGTDLPIFENIKGTDYFITLSPKYIKDKASFIITKNEELTDSDRLEMEEVDNYISNILNSEYYNNLSIEEKVLYIEDELNNLATLGTDKFPKPLIEKESIVSVGTAYSVTISFRYSCGVLGSYAVTDSNLIYTIDNNMGAYNSKYSKRGVYYDTLNSVDAPSFYIIAMGIRNTGGYSIIIDKVNIDKYNNVEVIVKETNPKSDTVVTDAITYPTCQLTLNNLPKSIIVKNTNGEIFQHINF